MSGGLRRRAPKLRLVHDRTRPAFGFGRVKHSQLMLPLSIPHNIVIIDAKNLGFRDFEDAICFVAPRWILDFRRIARFDVIAGGRSHAFRLFEKYSAGYADIMGLFRRGMPFHEMKRISLWKKVFSLIIKKDQDFSGPFLVISDNFDEFFELSDSILLSLERLTSQKYGISLIHRAYFSADRFEFLHVI